MQKINELRAYYITDLKLEKEIHEEIYGLKKENEELRGKNEELTRKLEATGSFSDMSANESRIGMWYYKLATYIYFVFCFFHNKLI